MLHEHASGTPGGVPPHITHAMKLILTNCQACLRMLYRHLSRIFLRRLNWFLAACRTHLPPKHPNLRTPPQTVDTLEEGKVIVDHCSTQYIDSDCKTRSTLHMSHKHSACAKLPKEHSLGSKKRREQQTGRYERQHEGLQAEVLGLASDELTLFGPDRGLVWAAHSPLPPLQYRPPRLRQGCNRAEPRGVGDVQ